MTRQQPSPFDNGMGLLGAGLLGQFTGGRYRAQWFYLIAAGLILLCLPLILTGVSEAWIYVGFGLPFLWLDWRHDAVWELSLAFTSWANVQPDEVVQLRSAIPVRRFAAIEIVATDAGIRWASRALSDSATTLGLTGRTAIDFHEIARVERTGNAIRIWTRTDSYPVSIHIRESKRGSTINEWMAFLKDKCPEAEVSVREPEVVRNSPLLKPLIGGVIVLSILVPWIIFLTIEMRS